VLDKELEQQQEQVGSTLFCTRCCERMYVCVDRSFNPVAVCLLLTVIVFELSPRIALRPLKILAPASQLPVLHGGRHPHQAMTSLTLEEGQRTSGYISAFPNVGLVVWQAGFVLAEWLIRAAPLGAGAAWRALTILELGCGVGQLGVPLACTGARVTLTDLPHITPLTEENVELNRHAMPTPPRVMPFIWGTDPSVLGYGARSSCGSGACSASSCAGGSGSSCSGSGDGGCGSHEGRDVPSAAAVEEEGARPQGDCEGGYGSATEPARNSSSCGDGGGRTEGTGPQGEGPLDIIVAADVSRAAKHSRAEVLPYPAPRTFDDKLFASP
jgi:hypothetical protein